MSYQELFELAMQSLEQTEATWLDMADRGAISRYEAHRHIRLIGMTRERILDDYFA